MCDVGQGDSILIYKQNFQLLVDGGPDYSVLTCLQKHVPWWDKNLEIVMMTHAEEDHAKGLIPVFERYNVQYFIKSKFENSTEFYQVLKEREGSEGSVVILASEDRDIRYGSIYLDILHPTDSIQAQSEGNGKLNEYSIVSLVSYGELDFLLTGDIQGEGVDRLLSSNSLKDVDLIKIPHHGSKNGLTSTMLEVVKPELALISAGKKNRYGHPHKEILDMLEAKGVRVRRTDLEGEIELRTYGVKLTL